MASLALSIFSSSLSHSSSFPSFSHSSSFPSLSSSSLSHSSSPSLSSSSRRAIPSVSVGIRLGLNGDSRRPFVPLLPSASASASEAVVKEEEGGSPSPLIKDFLNDLKPLGRVRIIVNTGVGVLESVTTLEKLFYHTLPGRGEYANVMNKEDNVDFHLLIDKVKSAKLEKGKSMRGDIPTYMVRFIDEEEDIAVSFLVMWKPNTNGEYDVGQVEAFQDLLSKYGEEIKFIN